MSRFLLKRDDVSLNAPAPEQIEIGELLLNAKTGKLYTKLVSGDIIEYIGSKVCFTTIPVVKFYYEEVNTGDIIENFCCSGGMLFVEIEKLKLQPTEYGYTITELTNNTTQNDLIINDAEYTIYTESEKTYRKAVVPITISVNANNYKNISIFKFNIFVDGNKLSEHLITLQCIEAL